MSTVGFSSPVATLCDNRLISCRLPAKQLRFRIRCSAEATTNTAAAEYAEAPSSATSESAVETPRRSPSLISSANVQKALRGLAITDADHYGRLGVARGISTDQVKLAFKNKCEELMAQALNEDKVGRELELLKESYAVLSSEEERRLYDWSLARSEQPDRYIWPFQVDKTQTSTEEPPPQVLQTIRLTSTSATNTNMHHLQSFASRSLENNV